MRVAAEVAAVRGCFEAGGAGGAFEELVAVVVVVVEVFVLFVVEEEVVVVVLVVVEEDEEEKHEVVAERFGGVGLSPKVVEDPGSVLTFTVQLLEIDEGLAS